VALIFSIYTVFYYCILALKPFLTITRLALFAFTSFVLKKSKHNERGITFQPDWFTTSNAFMNTKTFKTSLLGLQPETVQQSNLEFGGGDSGGIF
jgi:hypothetical protein